MTVLVNQELVNDTAKLMIHRLIAREIGRDPSLMERAKAVQERARRRYDGRSFVRDWDELLSLPSKELRSRLVSRDPEMFRLRLSSPFYTAEGVDLTRYDVRIRIRRAARRVLERRLARADRSSIVS